MNLPAALAKFTQPHDVEQLRALQDATEGIRLAPLSIDEIRAIFDLYERFPEEDGYGIFWSLLHAVEASGSYENELLASVGRVPGEFNVTMIGRIFNAGINDLAGQDIYELLSALTVHPSVSARARETAAAFIKIRGSA